MKIEKKKINFEDARGTITDILYQTPIEHATIITSKKGAVRGNHYHRYTTQTDFVVSGRMRILVQKVGETDITETFIATNDLITYEPSEAHAMIMEEDTVFITFTRGPRGGEHYESDTIRLDVPLETQKVTKRLDS